MWTETTLGKKCDGCGLWTDRGEFPRPRLSSAGAALLAFSLLVAGAGCAHKELLAPCSDYKAAAYNPAARPGMVPCDAPLHMHRPPWVTAELGTEPGAAARDTRPSVGG